MARPPKPTSKHALDGTHSQTQLQDTVEFELITKLPTAPDFLGPRGQDVWNEIGGRLVACKILQEPDLYALSVLCAMQEHVEHVFATARGDHAQEITAAHITSLRQLYGEFGMTPASRRKVPSNDHQAKQNPFAQFKRPTLVA